MKRSIVFAFAMVVMIALPQGAAAHGTDYRVIEEAPVIAAEFFYSDKEPMRYAEVLIYSPENDKVEYQNGRTDQNGRFAFCPESSGEWRIKVNDGMGHAVHAAVEVKPQRAAGGALKGLADKKNPAIAETSKWIKIFLGLSILLNLFLGMYVWKPNLGTSKKQ